MLFGNEIGIMRILRVPRPTDIFEWGVQYFVYLQDIDHGPPTRKMAERAILRIKY